MDIWHILTIILFTTQIVSGILCNGNTVEINFLVRMFWVIIWNVILYNGGFWAQKGGDEDV